MVSSVDLPEPLGPITATMLPAPTARSTSSSARTSAAPWPYTRDTCRISSTFISALPLCAAHLAVPPLSALREFSAVSQYREGRIA